MNILIANSYLSETEELRDYLQSLDHQVEIAPSRQAICKQLVDGCFDLLLISVSNLEDFATIRYVNSSYPKLKVLVSSDDGLASTIDNVRSTLFDSIHKPFHLSDLGCLIDRFEDGTL